MSKMMVKRDGLWTPMANLKGDTGPLPADNSVTNDALVTDGAKTNTAYLMGNRLTATAEGEMISVDDSYPSAALSLTVDGKSTQVQTTGKNLLSDIPEEWVKRTFNGLSGSIASFALPIEEGVSYYYVNTSTNGLSPGLYGAFCDTLEGTITLYDRVTLTNYNDRTFTNSDNHLYLIFVATSRNNTAKQSTDQFKSYKVFLSKTSSDTYEPYSGGAASPRPDWPQEIVSIDDLEAGFSGINLFDISRVNTSIHTVDGTTITSGGSETYRDLYSGAIYTSSTTFTAAQMAKMLYLPAGTYRVIYTPVTSGTVRVAGIYVNPSTGKPITDSLFFTAGAGVSFRMPDDGYLVVAIRYDNTTIKDLQISPRTTAYPYTSFTGFTIGLLDLTDHPLRSLPDGTKDELYLTYLRLSSREGWAWYEPTLMQRCYEDVLSGPCTFSENMRSQYMTDASVYFSLPLLSSLLDTSRINGWMCDSLSVARDSRGECIQIWRTQHAADWPNSISKAYASTVVVAVRMENELFGITKNNTAVEIKAAIDAYLQEHPITLCRPLATPITTQLDPIELPIMQAGTTNIWTDPSTSLSVTYERDRNIVISKLEAAAADLATS